MNERSEAYRAAPRLQMSRVLRHFRSILELTRLQIFPVLRDMKWMIMLSTLVSLVLYAPDQLREIYRIIYADISPGDVFLRALLPVVLIGFMCWLAAHHVAVASVQERHVTRIGYATAEIVPPMLGVLPLLACAWGQYNSLPNYFSDAGQAPAGSPWDDAELGLTVGRALTIGAFVVAALALLAGVAFWFAGRRLRQWSHGLNASQLCSNRFLVVVLLLMFGMTLAYVLWPLALPRFFGVFGILATFVLCAAAFVLYFSLLTLRHGFPFIPLILGFAIALSVFDVNDNHEIRLLRPGPDTPDLAKKRPPAWDEFKRWHESRPDRSAYEGEEYPVYIVTAQGGGIYAAYQTAVFLARLQDYCPAFRHHVFAISSVSGGSLGAATFAALLNAEPFTPAPSGAQPAGAAGNPCPAIARYLRPNRRLRDGLESPRPLEQQVKYLLANDFLSPLVAAALFPDFLQRFVPIPIPWFDRARVLETSFEHAMRGLKVGDKPVFERSFLRHWDPTASSPALLMNATDAGSGRRYLFSPFDVWTGLAAKGRNGSLVHFHFGENVKAPRAPDEPPQTLDIRLSTAVGISARFPWLTPAATVPINDFKPSTLPKVRLVDGGYVDNSGVETALDLVQSLTEEMEPVREPGNEGRRVTSAGKTPFGKVRFSLIVLSGGDFPVRGSFALGETIEPVRTFLNTRESRAYAAIERANRTLQPQSIVTFKQGDTPIDVMANAVKATSLTNRFYEMPLGWTLSDRTRDIIARQSGRYWDCDPDENFGQSADGFPATDCIQLLVYHELNRSLAEAGKEVGMSKYARLTFNIGAPPKLNHGALVRCYRDRALQDMTVLQSRTLRALLMMWDANPEWNNDLWLGYILAVAAQESGDFRPLSHDLPVNAAEIARAWPQYFPTEESARAYANNPKALANKLYGPDALGPSLGNTEEGDGWRYRGRGTVEAVGRAKYREMGELLNVDLLGMPDLMLLPEVAAGAAIVQFLFPEERFKALEDAFKSAPQDWHALLGLTGLPAAMAVGVRAKMTDFLPCIAEARQPAKSRRVYAD